MECRYCAKTIPNKRHEALCGRNPSRPKGAATKKKAAKPLQRKPEAKPEAAEAAPAATGEPGPFAVDATGVPDEGMPDFSGEEFVFGAPPQAPPGAPQIEAKQEDVAPDLMWESVVSVICDSFELAVKGSIGDEKAEPGPPESISKEDKEKLGQSLSLAMQAYGGEAGEFMTKWAPALNLAFVTGAVFLPRIMQAREYIAHQKAQQIESAAVAQLREGIAKVDAPGIQPEPEEPEQTGIEAAILRRNARIEAENAAVTL